jgi:hypothetical protein
VQYPFERAFPKPHIQMYVRVDEDVDVEDIVATINAHLRSQQQDYLVVSSDLLWDDSERGDSFRMLDSSCSAACKLCTVITSMLSRYTEIEIVCILEKPEAQLLRRFVCTRPQRVSPVATNEFSISDQEVDYIQQVKSDAAQKKISNDKSCRVM